MKKIWFCVVSVIVLFISCYEINEDIVINDNGTGTYSTRMDMSALIQMMQTMMGEEELAKSGLNRSIDTLIRLKSVLDTAKNVSDEEKRLFSDGTLNLQLDMEKSVFKTNMQLPFKSLNDLQKIMMGSGNNTMGSVFREVFSQKDSAQNPAAPKNDGFDQINNIYDVKITRHEISRSLNKKRYDSVMSKPEIMQAKQMAGGGVEILFTTTIRLPSKVKKVDNAELIKLSDDKKTVTIRYDIMKLLDTPDKFSYKIEY
jgi:hypothetical protein